MKHYIRINENSFITHGFSTYFEKELETDICIKENAERHFELNGVVNASLFDENGICLYKYENGLVIERTKEERLAEYESIKLPTPDPDLTLEERIDRLELLTLKANEVI